METEKMTHLQSLVELGLSSTLSTILTQCSVEIFQVIIDTLSVPIELNLVITYTTAQKFGKSHIVKYDLFHCLIESL